MAAYLARKWAEIRVIEAARNLNREPMKISLGVKKVENLLQREKAMAKKVEITERNMMERSKKKYFITIA